MAGFAGFILGLLGGAGLGAFAYHRVKTGGARLTNELAGFFGRDPLQVPLLTRAFSSVDLPNLQSAISQFIEETGSASRVVGYSSAMSEFHNNLRGLLGNDSPFNPTRVSGAQYRSVDVGVGEQMECVENGIHLIEVPSGRLAAHVRSDRYRDALELEVVAFDEALAAAFLDNIQARIAASNVYRGKILSLQACAERFNQPDACGVTFHAFAPIAEEDLILPLDTRALIERNTLCFFENADMLRRASRSLKRGLLFHGKPGTGKTYTARWLAQRLPGVTTIILSGEQLRLVKECCNLARLLAPALVIMEDVDLIAQERDEKRHPALQINLHQLLNEMDGLSSSAEVLFLLTTNRPDVLEPALAARPGRVDQAIEFRLPDADCRKALLERYGRGLFLDLERPDEIIERTEGASPAFIQELLRKAALIAAEQGSEREDTLLVTDAHLDEALRELVTGGGELTRNLLGFNA